MNDQSLIHSSFEYAPSSESESLGHMRTYAVQPPYVNGGVPSEISFRPDNYGVLGLSLQHPTSLTGAKGYRYSSNPGVQDVPPFQSLSGLSMSPLESNCGSSSTSPRSASSSSLFSPQTTFSTNGSTTIGSCSSAASVPYPAPTVSFAQAYMPVMYDGRPRIPSSSAGMPPPLLSQNHNTIPLLHTATAREPHTASSFHPQSFAYPHGNPSFLSSSQQPMLSTSRAQRYNMPIETSHYVTSSHAAPPFENTRNYQTIVDNKGQQVQVDLNAKIDKGFFKAENDWTCYRRNYFSVACSYTLKPPYQPSREPIYLSRPAATNPDLIRALAVCITARVNGEDGKTIDLVQHTPKRDKGPLGRPEKIKLMPSPPGSSGPYSEPATLSPNAQLNSEYDTAYQASPPNSQSPTTANFDRIQFKNATANNGKRRAAQQYFNIVVELFAELPTGQSAEVQWVKVASRTSARMVVRGRSPGHYSDDRRGSSAGMGPGGGSGGGGAGPRDPNAGAGVPGAPRGPRAEMGITQDNSGRLATGAYLSTPASHHTYSSAESRSSTSGSSYDTGLGSRIDRPDCPLLSAEDDSAIQDQEGYRYFPSPLYEPIPSCTSARPHLPPVRNGIFKSEMEPPGAHHGTSYGLYGNSGVGHHTNPDLNRSSVRNGGSSVKSDIEPSASSQHGAGHAHPEGTRPIKSESHESSEAGSTRLWPLTSTVVSPSGGRHCGRFQGVETSAGFYPLTPAL